MTTGTITKDLTVTDVNHCGSDPAVGMKYVKSWSGADLPPGYVRGGVLPPHNYSCTVLSTNNPNISYSTNSGASYFVGSDTVCWGGFATVGVSAGQQDTMYRRSLKKLQSQIETNDFDLSVFLGTGHQTLHEIADSTLRVFHAYKAIRRGDVYAAERALFSEKRSRLDAPLRNIPSRRKAGYRIPRYTSAVHKDASANWLKLQYGWLPLISDVYQGSEKLAKQLNRPISKRYSARASFHNYEAAVGTPSSNTYKRDTDYGVNIVAYVSETGTPLQQSGLTNPENLVWELLPWSFVVDWFLPIGNYLESRAFSQRILGTFVTTTYTNSYCYSRKGNGSNIIIKPSGAYKRLVSIDRSVSNTLLVKLPTVQGLGEALSWRRAANAVALLTQSFL